MNNVVRKVILRHAATGALMTVFILETAGGFSYGVDNFVSMPMSRRRAMAKHAAIIKSYTTHQSFAVQVIEGVG